MHISVLRDIKVLLARSRYGEYLSKQNLLLEIAKINKNNEKKPGKQTVQWIR